ncbi:MAG: tyrosine-type recombinase/integrase [Bacteroidetes bacterium]|nr:tyrosine-type recombinase/integrase [Bacteroidota bacterium]
MQFELAKHHNANVIFCYFEYNPKILETFKNSYPQAKWSRLKSAWFLPDTSLYRKRLNIPLPEIGDQLIPKLYENNKQEFLKFRNALQQKAFSPNTIKLYLNEFAQLLILLKNHPVQNLTSDRLNSYFLYCIKTLKHSESHVYSRMNAIKSYFSLVQSRSEIFDTVIRPKPTKTLPKVLSSSEVKRLFQATQNLKHLLILKIAYGMGLRVSEIISLQLAHIDIDRMQVLIACSKGKKDRYVNFPQSLIQLYQDYLKMYQPSKHLFEGQFAEKYTTRSAQAVFKNAMTTAGISKTVGIHGLRHSYATHLLEAGTDMVFIQKLLGHSQIKTTEIYAKVSNRIISQVKSPLDSINPS